MQLTVKELNFLYELVNDRRLILLKSAIEQLDQISADAAKECRELQDKLARMRHFTR